MRNRRFLLLLSLFVLALGSGWAPADLVHRGRTSAVDAARVDSLIIADPLPDYAFYLPPGATARQRIQIVVALHGMGGNGPDFAKSLFPLVERHGFALLAPTMPYRDYRDPEQVRRDGELHPKLKSLIDALPARTGLAFGSKVLLLGFSRGSQEANRFALMYPEATLGVAGLAAGSYTLPNRAFPASSQSQSLPYPYGTADVELICGRAFDSDAARKVNFWIAVGARDVRSEDVPRQWDPYVGTTRVERAQRFVSALQQFGASAELAVFPNAGHEMTDQMRLAAIQFLTTVSS